MVIAATAECPPSCQQTTCAPASERVVGLRHTHTNIRRAACNSSPTTASLRLLSHSPAGAQWPSRAVRVVRGSANPNPPGGGPFEVRTASGRTGGGALTSPPRPCAEHGSGAGYSRLRWSGQ
eukprot:scaffold100_cov357-Prasinococcus_capsulatus_cf.AAC.25